ncbi:AAA domain-containing protein [Pseudomonas sp. NFACC23-1]|uniref:AAA family ATPase n=1 Tax=unclassified Pseudomonas TaxID=196821 RepID=UPI00087F058F|nr:MULTISPECIES: AAA family ATPase [unclassified Pseudomonas]SDB53818.1 AAA domain-containing protein [Pseudomonas sp. NFACC17-2]SEJ74404.1 AAA domain-containing protein [Pseudomonas sp. NFACC23-1]SFW86251.1 AAA domain-containing protein [Pseudomonas sp. NFACC16-2]
MTSALQDYHQFVRWIHTPENAASEDARRVANIVLQRFVEVAGTSRQRSQRSALLIGLMRELLATTAPTLPPIAPPPPGDGWQWSKLKHLKVGPFRGFRFPEPFDLHERITLFYGPNGSGKTSLCEALEFALLGAVDESGMKRIAVGRYLSNHHEGKYIPPELKAVTAQGQMIPVVADAEVYRFCFVEKNRIDAFSRIAAKPTVEKTELIAALFGMDQFNDFVGHFNDSMEGLLTLLPSKQVELTAKRGALGQDHEAVANEAVALAHQAQVESAYAASIQPGMTYSDLLAAIGSEVNPGRLQQLDNQLNQPPAFIYGISSAELLLAYQAADAAQKVVLDVTAELVARTYDSSFQDLYNAVLGLQHVAGDHCPACDTPLAGEHRVVHNPYEKATAGLAGLQALKEIQGRHHLAIQARNEASEALRVKLSAFAHCVTATEQSPHAVVRYLANPGVDPLRDWWTDGYRTDGSVPHLANQAVAYAQQLEQQDTQSALANAERSKLIAERDRLNQARVDVGAHAMTRQRLTQAVQEAKKRIADFEQDNAELIKAAADEANAILRDRRINIAYDQFLGLLRSYRTQLPGTLMAGLNSLALELYNEFNIRDLEADKLAGLSLPVTGEGRIGLSFRGKPDVSVDALQILSEGHVRCLGLAILLAKALKIGAPVIVFDDAINAIDHEHRQGIRETIFESQRFAGTQLLVTCHSNEFMKDVQNRVPNEHWTSYVFRHHNGNYQPRVLGNVAPQTYLLNARAAIDRGDARTALAESRQALEMLSDKLWRWLGKYEMGTLSLKIAGSGADPTLRGLCEAMLARLNKAPEFVHLDKPVVMQSLGLILGQPEQSLVWMYLNKGTHEEANKDDFDEALVEKIVVQLEALNGLKLKGR